MAKALRIAPQLDAIELRAQRTTERLHRLGSLLGRWHQWRRHYRCERGIARLGGPSDPEDELEALLMATIEAEIEALPLDCQRALQHVARAECLGVETITPGEVPTDPLARESLYAHATARLAARLTRAGIL